MYRAQRLAEFALYDANPRLLDSELGQYLAVTADDIKNAAAQFLDHENRVVLDIVPAAAEEREAMAAAAAPQPPGESAQPGAPPPQVPPAPETEPDQAKKSAEVPPHSEKGSGPQHV
jgi:hypothetical protein